MNALQLRFIFILSQKQLSKKEHQELRKISQHQSILSLLLSPHFAGFIYHHPAIESSIKNIIEPLHQENCAKELALRQEYKKIATLNLIVYKGFDLSLIYYPFPGMRYFFDIDCFIPKKDYAAKQTALLHKGYIQKKSGQQVLHYHLGHPLLQKDQTMLELHYLKNPSSFFEDLFTNTENSALLLKNSHYLTLPTIRQYYHLKPTFHVFILILQLLKNISMANWVIDAYSLFYFTQDIRYILEKEPVSWKELMQHVHHPHIYMRMMYCNTNTFLYLIFYYLKTMGIFFTDTYPVEKKPSEHLRQNIHVVTKALSHGKCLSIRTLCVEKDSLALMRGLYSLIQPLFFKHRNPLSLKRKL